MAKSKLNVVTHGLSGKIAELLVFRQKDGKTIVSKAPKDFTSVTSAQEAIRQTFKAAVRYAKAILTDPAIKLAYKSKAEPGQSPFNLAIADFFQFPEIEEIDATGYTGQAGSTIKVPVTDDFKVVTVKVKIENADGSLVEEGDATLQDDGLHWHYTSTQTNSSLTGDIITVTAYDLPGHASSKQKTM